MPKFLTVSDQSAVGRYFWTPTGFGQTGTARLFAPAFSNNFPGLVPTGTNAGAFLRDDGTWQVPISGGTPSGVLNSQLADMPTGTVKARLTGTGAPGDVSIATLHAFAPSFTSVKAGVVPPSGGGTTNFLRADGTWTTPAAGAAVPSGPSFSVQFNNGGAFEGATGIRVVGSGGALLVGPSGGVEIAASGINMGSGALRFEKNTGIVAKNAAGSAYGFMVYTDAIDNVGIGDAVQTDGIYADMKDGVGGLHVRWGAQDKYTLTKTTLTATDVVGKFQALTVVSGIGNEYLNTTGSGMFKGRITGTGLPQDISLQTMVNFTPTFTATTRGTVPPSGGGTANYLRADGSWAVPPGGAASAPSGPSFAVQFNNNGAFDGATGISIVASGQALAFGPSGATSGRIRLGAGDAINWTHPNGFAMQGIAGAPDGVVSVGSPSGTELDLNSSSVVDMNIGGVALAHRWSALTYDMASGTQLRNSQNVQVNALSNSGLVEFYTQSSLRGAFSASAMSLQVPLSMPTGVAHIGRLSLGSGITNSQMDTVGSGMFKGRLTGTGAPQDVALQTMLAFAPTFTATKQGDVPPSGGGTDNYLRADGTWTAPSGAHQFPNAGGVTNLQLASMASGTVKGQLGPAGTPADVSIATLHAFIPTFTATQRGVVPLSGGGTTNFLRADGTWATPPGQAGSPGGGLGAIQYHDGVAFGGATGVTIQASGQALMFGVPSFLPNFGDIRVASGFDITARLPSGSTQQLLDWTGGGGSGVYTIGGASGVMGTQRNEVATGGSFQWLVGGQTGMSLQATGLDLRAQHLAVKSIDVGHINGLPFDFAGLKRFPASVITNTQTGLPSGLSLYPPRGAASGGNRLIIPSGAVPAARTITIRPTGGRAGEIMRIERHGVENFAVTISPPSGNAYHVMPSGTRSFVDLMFEKPSGLTFTLGGHGDLF